MRRVGRAFAVGLICAAFGYYWGKVPAQSYISYRPELVMPYTLGFGLFGFIVTFLARK